MADRLTTHEALIWVMATTSVADRTMTDRELGQLDLIVRRLPVFADFDGDIARIVEGCAAHLRDADGIEAILDAVAEGLPPRLYETAYALAVEVAAVDLAASQEELQFLQMLEDRLELPKLAVAAIEHSARVRYRKPA
jgi:tellurite resistance protein